jgi:hypothetical protein
LIDIKAFKMPRSESHFEEINAKEFHEEEDAE